MSQLESLGVLFSKKLIEERPYAQEEIQKIIDEAIFVLEKNKDKSFLELTKLMIEDTIKEFEKISSKEYSVPVPGISVGLNVNDTNIHLMDGKQTYNGKEITQNSLFDIASMTKLYTAIISYQLIHQGYYRLESKVRDICPEFSNIGDLTIDDLMIFNASFKTNGRVDDSKTQEEAKERFYTLEVKSKNYEYNDFHTMILKEIMEKVTKETYEQLLDKYIVKPLNLKNTYLTVPDEKKEYITGTANHEIFLPNDPKAVILGSGGHAGIFSSNNDIITFSKNSLVNPSLLNSKFIHNLIVSSNCLDAKANIVLNRGGFGSTYVNHPQGLDKTFLDKTFFSEGFAYQGSTRTQGMGFRYNVGDKTISGAATILQNPASTDFELAKHFQEEINAKTTRTAVTNINKPKTNFSFALAKS